MSVKSTLSSAAVIVTGAFALSACQSATTSTSSAPPAGTVTSGGASASQSAPAPATPPASLAPGTSSTQPSAPSSTAPSAPAASTHSSGGAGSSGGNANATSDSYAYAHPCTSGQLSVKASRLTDTPSRWLITVRNTGANSCGLTYFPRVDIGNSHSVDASHNVKPMIPGGLGGPPASPVYAGQTAYAVIDLNPSHATTGTVPGLDVMNVLPVSTMPNAATLNFPLGSGALVLKPKMGLYERSAADAVASMLGANTQQ